MDIHLISIEVGIEWGTYAFIESESFALPDSNFESHHGDSMQTWLSIENNNIPILYMSLNYISNPQRNFPSHWTYDKLISRCSQNEVGSISFLRTSLNAFL